MYCRYYFEDIYIYYIKRITIWNFVCRKYIWWHRELWTTIRGLVDILTMHQRREYSWNAILCIKKRDQPKCYFWLKNKLLMDPLLILIDGMHLMVEIKLVTHIKLWITLNKYCKYSTDEEWETSMETTLIKNLNLFFDYFLWLLCFNFGLLTF